MRRRDQADSAVLEARLEWAAGIARTMARRLPPSFERSDLEQEARIAAWRAHEQYDESRRVPYEAFALRAVRGAVMMSVRRRAWREATHDEMPSEAVMRDERRPEEQIVERIARDEAYRIVRVRMEELPSRARRAVMMHYLHGLPVPMVAARMKRSETWVYATLKEARERLIAGAAA